MIETCLAEVKNQGELKLSTQNPQLMEDSSMPQFTNRTAGTASQTPPIGPQSHCSTGRGTSYLLAHSSAPPGPSSTGPLDLPQTPNPQACTGQHDLQWATNFRPATPAIHRPTQSPQGHAQCLPRW
jgi:hypothetical protein